MPSKPNKVKRDYRLESKPFSRSVDNQKFYNSWTWRKFTKGFKIRNPFCVLDCKKNNVLTPTTVVDHKEQYSPGALGWNLKDLKDEYFNAGCDECHNKRSAKQRHGINKI